MAAWDSLTDSIAYWYSDTGKQTDLLLQLSPRSNPESEQAFCPAPLSEPGPGGHVGNYLSSPVLIGPGKFAVLNHLHEVCILDAVEKSLSCTTVRDCWPQASRMDGSSLICTDIASWQAFEVDLDSNTKPPLPGLSGRGFLMLPGLDRLIYTKAIGRWFPIPHEKTVTMLYDLTDKTECLFNEEPLIYPNRGVWVPEE